MFRNFREIRLISRHALSSSHAPSPLHRLTFWIAQNIFDWQNKAKSSHFKAYFSLPCIWNSRFCQSRPNLIYLFENSASKDKQIIPYWDLSGGSLCYGNDVTIYFTSHPLVNRLFRLLWLGQESSTKDINDGTTETNSTFSVVLLKNASSVSEINKKIRLWNSQSAVKTWSSNTISIVLHADSNCIWYW